MLYFLLFLLFTKRICSAFPWCSGICSACSGKVLIVSRKSALRSNWRGFNVICSVFCNQGGAANAAEIFVVVAGSVKTAAFYMHIGCACFAPYSTAAYVVVTYVQFV